MDDIGLRLRRLRELRGLSQRTLARLSGVSNATISLIENRRTDPSLGLFDAIPISLGDFFGMDVHRAEQVFYGAEELVEIGSGPISYRQVGGDLGQSKLQMLYETYAPGADTGQSLLTHDGEESGVVISGRLEVTVGEQVRVLRAGDAYRFNSRTPHRFHNVGREPCVLVSACTPPSF